MVQTARCAGGSNKREKDNTSIFPAEVLMEVEMMSGPSGACVSALIPPEAPPGFMMSWQPEVLMLLS